MRFANIVVAALAVASGVAAVDVQRSIIVSYPSNTDNSVINRAMDEIKKAGGVITHQYNLIKGFAALAPQKAIDSVSAWSTQYNVVIEEDQEVHIAKNVH